MSFKQSAIRGQQIIIQKLILPRMQEKGISAYALAKLSGISEASISRWLNGKQNITLTVFLAICGALDINPYFEIKEGQTEGMFYEYFN